MSEKSGSIVMSETPGIIRPRKSPSDDRNYETFALSNYLKVTVVSDMKSTVAAASLSVEVGYFSDPIEIPGLAHFLEHMLFLGNTKYPGEGSYMKYIQDHGGSANAETGPEMTSYHFNIVVPAEQDNPLGADVENDANGFHMALDRFANFFISPLFTESATDREIQAVESEYSQNKQSDGRRIGAAEAARQNPEHPISRFGSGSKSTLHSEPLQKGIDVRGKLIEFYNMHYSANRMYLSIAGPYPTENLRKIAETIFGQIPNKNVSSAYDVYANIKPVRETDLCKTLYVETISNFRVLSLSWYLPSLKGTQSQDVCSYVAGLLGYEGRGSVRSFLKDQDWATSLDCGIFRNYEHFSVFGIELELTEKGVCRVDNVIDRLFAFLRLIQNEGVREWIHEENGAQSEIDFRFSEAAGPYSTAIVLSQRMCEREYSDYELVCGPYVHHSFDEQAIRSFLRSLNPEMMGITLAGHFAAEKVTDSEKWYGARFGIERVEQRQLSRWKSARVGWGRKMRIQAPNTLIAKDFKIIAESPKEYMDHPSSEQSPLKIITTPKMDVYYFLDRTFLRPRASIHVFLTTGVAYESVSSSILTDLYVMHFGDALDQYGYDCSLAGISFGMSPNTRGISLTVDGYNDRLSEVLEKIVVTMIDPELVSEDRFLRVRESYERQVRNSSNISPLSQARMESASVLTQVYWRLKDELEYFESGSLSRDTLQRFIPRLTGKLHAKVLVHGNVSESWTRKAAGAVEKMEFESLPEVDRPERRSVALPQGLESLLRVRSTNPEDENSATSMMFYICEKSCDSLKPQMIAELLADAIGAQFFDILRTQQQLGYVVFSRIGTNGRSVFLTFNVQGTLASPKTVRFRILEFVFSARKLIEEMTDVQFETLVNSACLNRREVDKTMFDQGLRMFNEITLPEFQFDRQNREILALRSLKMEDLLDLYDAHVLPGSPMFRLLSTQVFGCLHPMNDGIDLGEFDEVKWNVKEIVDVLRFKQEQQLFPGRGLDPLT